MHADIQGCLESINKSYKMFEHNGMPMTKDQVIKVLTYGKNKGYKSTSEFNNAEVEVILKLKQL